MYELVPRPGSDVLGRRNAQQSPSGWLLGSRWTATLIPTESTWSWVATQSLGTGVGTAVADGASDAPDRRLGRLGHGDRGGRGDRRQGGGRAVVQRQLASQDERNTHDGEGEREDEPA